MIKKALGIVMLLTFVFGVSPMRAGEQPARFETPLRYALLEAPVDTTPSVSTGVDFSSFRFRKAVIMSIVIPGSGQTYFGQPTKGAAFSVVAIGSLVAGYIYHSDIVSNNERLQDVRTKYKTAGSYSDAQVQYLLMQALAEQSNRYETRRTICFVVAGAAWALNIADMMFNTTDQGRDDMLAATTGKLQLVPQADGAAIRFALSR
jgi:hypothetical protein